MPRSVPRSASSALGVLALGLVLAGGTPAQAAPPAPVQQQQAATCHRTLASYPVLHKGDRRPAVKTLQCLLNDDGYGPLTVDGWYGPQTRAAIRDLESTFEGTPTRPYRIGGGMWTLMISRTMPDRTLHVGDHGHAVVLLQRALRAGGGTLTVDGDFGPETRAAVEAFQRHNGLRATGRVNDGTRFYLHQGAVTRAPL